MAMFDIKHNFMAQGDLDPPVNAQGETLCIMMKTDGACWLLLALVLSLLL